MWPEIFGEVQLNVLPLLYLHKVCVNFKDGNVWEIKITPETKKSSWKEFEDSLVELITEYEALIDNVDFKLDTARVKRDIERRTQKFLKNKTL